MTKENSGLLDAVRELYYAAHWTPDRDCDADRLWTNLRDAAGLTPGNAPTPNDKVSEFPVEPAADGTTTGVE